MDEMFEQFMIEGRELISTATDDLLALEGSPNAQGRIDSAFRAVHTLKGSVGIFDLGPMGAALHAAEDLLAAIRSAAVPMEAPVAQALLGCMDHCDRWMDAMEVSGVLPVEAPKDAVRIANGLASLAGTSSGRQASGEAAEAPWLDELLTREAARLEAVRLAGTALVAMRYTPREDCFFTGDDPLAFAAAIPELLALDIRPREDWPRLDAFDPYRCNLVIEAVSSAAMADLRQVFRFIPDQVDFGDIAPLGGSGGAAGALDPREAQRTIRVDAAQIDRLLDLVGELVIAKNGLAHLAVEAEAGKDPRALSAAIKASQGSIDRLVADMHQAVMTVRMVPLERVFRRLARLVREIAERLGREVALEVSGEETRVDKAIVDSLFEPLLHLVRNAIDHGIEEPGARMAASKPASGRLALVARTLGDQILIELSDDGAGIDPAAVRKAAAERGVLPREQLDALDDAAATQLIFAAGFSTASAVTDVSGRGVGMDAVKTAIERLGGRVSLASKPGSGTTVGLRLPATAALTTVLVVKAGGDRFAVPLDVVVETVRIPASAVMPIGLGRAFVLRNRTLPLVSLATLLGADAPDSGRDLKILVIDGGQGRVGIAVDDFSERMDVMLRPMTGLLANIPGVSGTTLLGDGSVLLILNLPEAIG